MTSAAWIVGTACTSFGRKADATHRDLAGTVYREALFDAGVSGSEVEAAWFGSCAMGAFGQDSIRGQACFVPLVDAGDFLARAPIYNVENACATGAQAFHGAVLHVLAGGRMAIAMGVEKLFNPSATAPPDLSGGSDKLSGARLMETYRAVGERIGAPFAPQPTRSLFMDTYAMQAAWYLHKTGARPHDIAIAAAKTHTFGADNEKAQYRFRMTPEQVLADRLVVTPLTRAMCAPIGDGAAAILVCSEDMLRALGPRARERAVRVAGIGSAGGVYRDLEAPSLTRTAAQRAYMVSGLSPEDVDVAEVHDATSFSELYQAEMMGFCPDGHGARFFRDGGGSLEHRVTINASGGLISKGHPIAATGCSMLYELVLQLRGEAGLRQKKNVRIGLAENAGGVIGLDEAIAFVTLLAKD